MDPFDDFEMKPINAGLGFHRKSEKLKASVKRADLVEEKVQTVPDLPPTDLLEPPEPRSARQIIDDMLQTIESTDPDVRITETLPRTDEEIKEFHIDEPEMPMIPEPEMPVPEPEPVAPPQTDVSQLFKKPSELDFVGEGVRRSAHDSPSRRLIPTSVSFSSALLDGLIVVAMSLVFLVSLILATGVDLFGVFANAKNDGATQIAMVVLFVAVMQMYVVVARSFFGRTIGEWTFDLQMGDDEQMGQSSYPALVLWRSVVVTLTGMFVLPVLSFFFRKDLASYFTGLQLYRKN